jgi:methylated-DNA-[protein]-cysteine S-methyltransferase
MPTGFTLFDTSIGCCGIAWSAQGITCIQLPESTRDATVSGMISRSGGAEPADPPAWVVKAIEQIARHLEGHAQDLSHIRLDDARVPAFHRRVYEEARRVGSGETVTYGELAGRAGSPGASRAVGQAMAKNPFPLIVPCHRVLAAGSRIGGFSAGGGLTTKVRLLALEGAKPPRKSPRKG